MVETVRWQLQVGFFLFPYVPQLKDTAFFNCSFGTEDGKFVGDSDVGEFWSLFGGYAPIPKDLPSNAEKPQTPTTTLFW